MCVCVLYEANHTAYSPVQASCATDGGGPSSVSGRGEGEQPFLSEQPVMRGTTSLPLTSLLRLSLSLINLTADLIGEEATIKTH